jgi:drug/metabolite transporter (DMT)-like permease
MHGWRLIVDDNQSISSESQARLMGLACCVLLLPVYFVFSHYSNSNKGFVAVCIAAVFCGVAYSKRESLKNYKLIIYLVIFCLIQLSAVALIALPSQFPGAVMIPIAFADVFLVLWIGSSFERV